MPKLDDLFLELRTIKEWHLTPAAWRAQSPDDRAMMLAYELFVNTCESYRMEWARLKEKEKEKGPNPFERMKQEMGLKF